MYCERTSTPVLGVLVADLGRGAQALVGVRRGHADVDDRDVGLVGADLAQQVLAVARLGDHLEARLLEQARDALAQQQAVVGQDYAHGTSALTVVPSPGGEWTSRRPSRAARRSARPRRPVPIVGIGPADAVVAHLDDGVGAVAPDAHGGGRRPGVLDDVGERLGHDEVGGRLDGGGQSFGWHLVETNR